MHFTIKLKAQNYQFNIINKKLKKQIYTSNSDKKLPANDSKTGTQSNS